MLPVVGWAFPGLLLSLVPLTATLPSTRLLLVPSLGASLIVGALLFDAGHALLVTRLSTRARVASWLRACAAFALGLLHLGVAPVATAAAARWFSDGQVMGERLIQATRLSKIDLDAAHVIVLNAAEPFSTLYASYLLEERTRADLASWHALTMTLQPVRVRHTDGASIELSVASGSLIHIP